MPSGTRLASHPVPERGSPRPGRSAEESAPDSRDQVAAARARATCALAMAARPPTCGEISRCGSVPQRTVGAAAAPGRRRRGPPKPTGAELGQQGVGVHDGPPGHVDQQRAVLHPGQEAGVHQAPGLVGERHDQHDHVGPGSRSGSSSMACTPSRADRATRITSTSNGSQPRLDRLADRAVPDEQHRAVGQRRAPPVGFHSTPVLGADELAGRRAARTGSASARARRWRCRGCRDRCTASRPSGTRAAMLSTPADSICTTCRLRHPGQHVAHAGAQLRTARRRTPPRPRCVGHVLGRVDHLVAQPVGQLAEVGGVEGQPDEGIGHAADPTTRPGQQRAVPGHGAGVGQRGHLVDDRPAAGAASSAAARQSSAKAGSNASGPRSASSRHQLGQQLPLPLHRSHPVLGLHHVVRRDPLEHRHLQPGPLRAPPGRRGSARTGPSRGGERRRLHGPAEAADQVAGQVLQRGQAAPAAVVRRARPACIAAQPGQRLVEPVVVGVGQVPARARSPRPPDRPGGSARPDPRRHRPRRRGRSRRRRRPGP